MISRKLYPAGTQCRSGENCFGSDGNITVSVSPDDQAHVLIHKYLRSGSDDEANKKNSSTQPKFEQQGSILVLDMVGSDFESVRCDVDVQLPAKSPLAVATRAW